MAAPPAAPDPQALLRSPEYVRLLVLAALIGVPVSVAAYGFLEVVDALQDAIFTDIPHDLGFDTTPTWWPVPMVALAGLLVAMSITYLPGIGGHSPADGFHAGGVFPPRELPGMLLAAIAGLSLGVVLGPEAPLILLGSGLGALAVRLAARDAPDTGKAVIAGAGSFAAISSLLGSPLLGAFLLLEASGLGGAMLGVVLVPGLLSAGIGTLVFIGLDSLTGFGTLSLAIPGVPHFGSPTGAMFAWSIVFGLVAPFLGRGIQLLALVIRPRIDPHRILLMPVLGLIIGGLAFGFAEATDKGFSPVLFSGQSGLGPLVGSAADWSVGALLLLVLCKSLAYSLALSSFRGGPVFPAMFIGAAAGIAASHLPGLSLVPGVAMGIGAMCTVMLNLPLTSTLLATLLLGIDGLNVMPLVIVAVVVAYVVTARLTPAP
jgi:H+/Cl- antiporter ClcA